MAAILLSPEKPRVDTIGALHYNIVPITSQNPELSVRFFNWLYSAQENHDLLLWGIEGTHWIKSDATLTYEDNTRQIIEIVKDEDGMSAYTSGGMWMLGNMNLKSYTDNDTPYNIAIDITPDDTVTGITVGFTFDTEAVSTEYVNLLADVTAIVKPLRTGVISYEQGFEDMRARLIADGLEKVVEEYQQQLDEYLGK